MGRTSAGLMIALIIGCGAIPCGATAESTASASRGAAGPPDMALAEAASLLASGQIDAARQLVDGLAQAGEGGSQRDFLDGMISYSARDYRRAEVMFRRILDREPRLVRVRLELARTLYMERKDEQADYHFSLAAAERPSPQVMRNIGNFREAIRARRSWRLSVDLGFAPDGNINSATDKESVDIHGLPFRLDPNARARSGAGRFLGADARIRLNRAVRLPIYVGVYGRWTSYRENEFDDAYAGAEAGPELQVAGGRLRVTASALRRWYGGQPLVTSVGTRLEFEKIVADEWTIVASLLGRRNDYAGRNDVDGWDVEARLSANRPLGLTTLGFANLSIERSAATDPGQAHWRGRVGMGMVKEVGWGLRPQIRVDLARQVNDDPLAPFGKKRRDWLLEGSFSIYKRDWNLEGFAPSLSLTATRNHSTLPLYDQRRLRGELRLTKAF